MSLFENPELEKPRWWVSGTWMRKLVNCSLHGIQNECGGCCKGKPGWTAKSVYPMRAFGDTGICGYYIEGSGCAFSVEERPLLCLLYPFMLNEKNLLVMYWRVLGGSCKKAYNTQGVPILVHMKEIWVHLFGLEQYERVYKEIILEGRGVSYFEPSEEFLQTYELECKRYEENIKPEGRKWKGSCR